MAIGVVDEDGNPLGGFVPNSNNIVNTDLTVAWNESIVIDECSYTYDTKRTLADCSVSTTQNTGTTFTTSISTTENESTEYQETVTITIKTGATTIGYVTFYRNQKPSDTGTTGCTSSTTYGDIVNGVLTLSDGTVVEPTDRWNYYITKKVPYNETLKVASVAFERDVTIVYSDCTSGTTTESKVVNSSEFHNITYNPSGNNETTEDREITMIISYQFQDGIKLLAAVMYTQEGKPSDTGTTPSSDTLSFAWSGDTTEQTYYLNGTQYTATTNPYSTTLTDLGVNDFTSANRMFSWATSITSITSIPDTSNVTDMSYMFQNCYGLTELDITKTFNTSNVTSMLRMFDLCSSLTELDLSSFDTSNVTEMSYIFQYCSSLQTLDVSSWNVNHLTNNYAYNMFRDCTSLTTLKVKQGTYDWWCARLTDANISCDIIQIPAAGGGTTSCDTLSFEFSGTSAVYSIYTGSGSRKYYTATTSPYSVTLSDLGISTIEDMYITSPNITRINSIFQTNETIQIVFNGSSATYINTNCLNTSNFTDMSHMFEGCSGLTSLDVSNFDTSNVTNFVQMFYKCSGLTSLDVSNFDTSSATNLATMFGNCYSLTSLDLSNFNTSNVTNIIQMFHRCSGLTSLDLSSFDTSNVTDITFMFAECTNLVSLNVSSWDVSSIPNTTNSNYSPFKGCTSLTQLVVKSGTYDWWYQELTKAGIQSNVTITEV